MTQPTQGEALLSGYTTEWLFLRWCKNKSLLEEGQANHATILRTQQAEIERVLAKRCLRAGVLEHALYRISLERVPGTSHVELRIVVKEA